jgi:hypothetical protein
MDDIENGQRINCNGVHGTVIGKRRTRNERFVLVKMDNGFTLKLNAKTTLETSPNDAMQTSEENFLRPTCRNGLAPPGLAWCPPLPTSGALS